MPREYPGAMNKPVRVRPIANKHGEATSLQVTIPAWIVRRSGLQPGDHVIHTIDEETGTITIQKGSTHMTLIAILISIGFAVAVIALLAGILAATKASTELEQDSYPWQ